VTVPWDKAADAATAAAATSSAAATHGDCGGWDKRPDRRMPNSITMTMHVNCNALMQWRRQWQANSRMFVHALHVFMQWWRR